MSTRRDFLKTTAATAASLAAARALGSSALVAAPAAEKAVEDLALEALDAARRAGASYADVRIGRYRRQNIATRERRVSNISDVESYGLGVWTDASDASVCDAVQSYRAASLAAGTLALPAPWPLADCPATFGNTNILSLTTG